MTDFPNTTRTTELLSLNMEKERIGYGLVTTATAYKKGDLLGRLFYLILLGDYFTTKSLVTLAPSVVMV